MFVITGGRRKHVSYITLPVSPHSRWQTLPDLSYGPEEMGDQVGWSEGRLVVAGGWYPSNILQFYNGETQSWVISDERLNKERDHGGSVNVPGDWGCNLACNTRGN